MISDNRCFKTAPRTQLQGVRSVARTTVACSAIQLTLTIFQSFNNHNLFIQLQAWFRIGYRFKNYWVSNRAYDDEFTKKIRRQSSRPHVQTFICMRSDYLYAPMKTFQWLHCMMMMAQGGGCPGKSMHDSFMQLQHHQRCHIRHRTPLHCSFNITY